jgi:hypothetical protein
MIPRLVAHILSLTDSGSILDSNTLINLFVCSAKLNVKICLRCQHQNLLGCLRAEDVRCVAGYVPGAQSILYKWLIVLQS